MRFTFRGQKTPEPTLGDRRVEKVFAILPIQIGNEVRWLEAVEIEQVWEIVGITNDLYGHVLGWADVRFIDDNEKRD